MTASEELTLLEAAYTALLQGGAQSYSINGRSLTKLDAVWMCKRMDTLRAQVVRDDPTSGGMFSVARFRNPD